METITVELELISAALTFVYIVLLVREHIKMKQHNVLFPIEKRSLSDQIVSRKSACA